MLLIWTLNRSTLERWLISFLMVLGLLAAGSAAMKAVTSNTFDYSSTDIFRGMMPLFFWCRMEEISLIVASSAPLLKVPIEKALHRLGLPLFQNRIRDLNLLEESTHPSKEVLDHLTENMQWIALQSDARGPQVRWIRDIQYTLPTGIDLARPERLVLRRRGPAWRTRS
ncbi:hypothetical protein DM02DRAFT_678585 [Periconia macrospinosa]|uniref:Uncharacterized protein n=1 Tax=Periconia macrospinosa TaxID=97972 RepID=A0A2V1CXL4_9PLEO|nr:hypothetical protein DM02DRAFT_678585 [Periconia macrospinosa]